MAEVESSPKLFSAQWLKPVIWLALSAWLNFTISYVIGFFYAAGFNALLLADVVVISNLAFHAGLATSMALFCHVVILRYATSEFYAKSSLAEMFSGLIADKHDATILIVPLPFMVLLFLAPTAAFGNLPTLLSLLGLLFLFFLWWLPTRTSIFENPRRIKKILFGRGKLVLKIFMANAKKFLMNYAVTIIFLIGSWAGFSRAEHQKNIEVTLLSGASYNFEKISLLFRNSEGAVFSLENGNVLQIPNANFILENRGKLNQEGAGVGVEE
ncbi:hypothetical protein [Roseovarius aestuariivivens]|uniref:hypothetical protein n=1 Tax=Roseovarius aestuariivivens TaxID=1888910 RepID=UPI0010801CDC|nr:hypothetical protein [Roseovarius aestuariivivens]